MVGSHKLISKTHNKMVPLVEIIKHLQITLGALDVRQRTIANQIAVIINAKNKSKKLNWATKPGKYLATLSAVAFGNPVILANQITQIKPPAIVKVNKDNQSIKLISPLRRNGNPKLARIAIGGKSNIKSRSLRSLYSKNKIISAKNKRPGMTRWAAFIPDLPLVLHK